MKLNAQVSTIMTKKVECVTPDQQLVDVKHLFEKTPFHHHIPVIENDKLVGMISLVDFMRAIGNASLDDRESAYQSYVRDIMTTHPSSVKGDVTIGVVARELAKGEIHALVVTNEGKVEGIVSYSDVIRYLLNLLE
jgi:acetoin utilization protein AcuB